MVLRNSHLMSVKHKRATLRRALDARCQLVLVVPQLNPADLSVFTGTVVCSAQVLHARITEDDVARYLTRNDVKEVSPFMLVYRALRLAFSSVVKPSTLPHGVFRGDAWRHEAGRKAIAAQVFLALDGVADRDIVAAFVDAVVLHVAAHLLGSEPPPTDGTVLGAEGSLLATLPKLCVRAVTSGTPLHQDVSFEKWVEQHRLCQFMSQRYRIATWVLGVFGEYMEEMQLPASFAVPPEGLDLHSRHLCMYFSRHVAQQVRKRSNVREGFVCGVRVSVMTPDEMHLSHAVLKQVSPDRSRWCCTGPRALHGSHTAVMLRAVPPLCA